MSNLPAWYTTVLAVADNAALLPNDFADWAAFFARTAWFFGAIALFILCVVLASRIKLLKESWWFYPSLLLFLACMAVIEVRMALGNEMLLTLLGSEDDNLAGAAYQRLDGHVDAAWLFRKVNDARQGSNARFYLSRMLAFQAGRSSSVANIDGLSNDVIEPHFFDRTELNRDIDILPKPLTPRKIAEHYRATR